LYNFEIYMFQAEDGPFQLIFFISKSLYLMSPHLRSNNGSIYTKNYTIISTLSPAIEQHFDDVLDV